MPRYAITERAGPFVATYRNAGVGTVLELTERQAEHELRLGTLVRLPERAESATVGPKVEPATVVAAGRDSAPASASEQETTVPPTSRKSKRSTS